MIETQTARTPIIIANGTVFDSISRTKQVAHIVIENGKFAVIENNIAELDALKNRFSSAKIIDADKHWIAPGLVDLRARFREPGLEYKASIESEALAAAKAGITSVCIPPDTDPIIDRPSVANAIQDKARLAKAVKIHTISALTLNLEGKKLGDIWTMANTGCVGTSNAKEPIESVLMLRRAMQYAASFDITIHLYPQNHELLGNGCVHEGLTSTRLGLSAIPSATEIVGLARDIALVETTGVKAHFMGISCARSVEMIANAQKNGLNITADVDIHHLLLNETDIRDFDSNFHIQPPIRTPQDQQALIDGINAGVISAVCSDHQPHDADAKLAPFGETEPGISSLEILLPGLLSIHENHSLPIEDLIATVTSNPAQIAGINAGEISVGSDADCIIIDPKNQWQFTLEEINSRGKNTPYIGNNYQGKCLQTIINGQLVD